MDGTNHSRGSTIQSLSPDKREDLEHELRPEALASIAREENNEASTNTSLCVIEIDNVGIGRSMAPRARKEYTIQRMADDVAAVVKHVWEDAEHHVIGHSMGGMIAMEYAARTKAVASLTLLSTTPRRRCCADVVPQARAIPTGFQILCAGSREARV